MSRARPNTFHRPESSLTSSTSWCWPAKHSMRYVASLGVTEFQIFKGALWSLRGNAWNPSEERQEQRKNLCRQYTKLGRAMSLRESLQAIYASPERKVAEAELEWWCGWAARSRLNPFRKLAKTVRQHWDGILAYDTRLTSAAIEAVNGIIQLAK